jgi:endoglucanase
MKKFQQHKIYFFLILFFPVQLIAQKQPITINEHEYLQSNGLSVLAWHNNYFVGKQGAIEIIKHDRRLITNGKVNFKLSTTKGNDGKPEFFSVPIPKTEKVERIINREQNTITLPFNYPDIGLQYDIVLKGKAQELEFRVRLKSLPDNSLIQEISFDMELSPAAFRGRSFSFENGAGLFPLHFQSRVEKIPGDIVPQYLGKGKSLHLGPEQKLLNMQISVENGKMFLIDTRSSTNHNWFTLKTIINKEKAINENFSMRIIPNNDTDYEKKPVIGYAQTGYHPLQKKELIIEVDTNYMNTKPLTLFKFDKDKGKYEIAIQKTPSAWGQYKRFNYLVFDFTGQRNEGLYYAAFDNDIKTRPFIIHKDVYKKGIWEPCLETFLPVQMCHMRIRDRNRIWHGVCHLDDALQAPTPLPFFDGFSQGVKTDTPFEPLETIPGLNHGGWHDAGDDDVNTNSTGRTVYHLALIKEEFGVDTDQTTIDFDKREVFLHRPDGESDLIQQIKHGLHFILPQYKETNHGIVGVISNSFDTYLIPGTWENMTDQLFYDSTLTEDQHTASHSGKLDDRYAFTNKDTRAEFRNIYVLAAAARALINEDNLLSDSCLRLAENIWKKEIDAEPVFYHSVGVPDDLKEQQIIAATELYLSNHKPDYLEFVKKSEKYILSHMENVSWSICRIIGDIKHKGFKKKFEKRLQEYSDSLTTAFAGNPYGTYLDATLWGYGWDILWRTYKHYYLVKNYPSLFSVDPIISCNEFMLGRHMYSNVSYVSGVGSELPIPAFGMNRSDYSYILGGVFSGVNMVEPDFPELMEEHPFIWQQSEYIIHGATPFIFTILAADKLLNR